jgi:hypothetical protein
MQAHHKEETTNYAIASHPKLHNQKLKSFPSLVVQKACNRIIFHYGKPPFFPHIECKSYSNPKSPPRSNGFSMLNSKSPILHKKWRTFYYLKQVTGSIGALNTNKSQGQGRRGEQNGGWEAANYI